MTTDDLIQLGQNAMWVTLIVSAPMLAAGMIVGLLISILQSVTQIQEITLTFIPKIIAVLLAFILFMPFISDTMLVFMRDLFANAHLMVR
ncbi:MAG: flagellar biosynthesis protein FliQ [Candidatus Hydrogenedentes bacterium]|nr:flagellar biosynthesis protein FliQ [Candidatus Hydrogenedentota bacterium]